MIEAIRIMRMVGIDYMLENGMRSTLLEKGILTAEQLDEIGNMNSDSFPLMEQK